MPEVREKHYTKEQLALLDSHRIPRHVALIMDGNRRWAAQHQVDSLQGHHAGAEALIEVVRCAEEIGVKVVTAYSFSTENWGRPPEEVKGLFHLFEFFLQGQKEWMIQEGVRLSAIGDLTHLPVSLQQLFKEVGEATATGGTIDLVLAINYGGKDEIRRAILKIVEECVQGKITKEEITEAYIAHKLDTAPFGDLDLLIRTSGELRSSNFLLWQMVYAELYFTEVLWPDFKAEQFLTAILQYQKRQRRRGS